MNGIGVLALGMFEACKILEKADKKQLGREWYA